MIVINPQTPTKPPMHGDTQEDTSVHARYDRKEITLEQAMALTGMTAQEFLAEHSCYERTKDKGLHLMG